MLKTLSIIVPVFNDAQALARLLQQLQPLRQAGAEVIVVDGGSRDDPQSVCRGQADHFVVSPRRGRAAQMNAGADVATGAALWFIHADTILPDLAADQVMQSLTRQPWGRFDVRIEGHSRWLPVVAWAMNTRSRITGIATGDQGLFFQSHLFRTLGGYADLPLMEDIDICKRALSISRPACLRSRLITSGRRWDTKGVWRTIFLMWSLRFRYWLGADARSLYSIYYPSTPKKIP